MPLHSRDNQKIKRTIYTPMGFVVVEAKIVTEGKMGSFTTILR